MTLDEIYTKYQEPFVGRVTISSQRFYDLLLQQLSLYTSQGVLQANEQLLAQLEQTIIEELRRSGYSDAANEYFDGFNEITAKAVSDYPRLNVKPVVDNSQIASGVLDETRDLLRRNGLKENLIKPIENLLRQNVLLGVSFEETANVLREMLVEKPMLVKYADQISYDAIAQYNGSLNDAIRDEFELTNFFYIGSIIEDSRPVCNHIKDNYKGKISTEQLTVILNDFCPNGVPSEDVIEYETIPGEFKRAKKGAGMMPNTTLKTWSKNRGGYRCRHDVRWTV
jgi:hypothetical protein